MDDNAVVSITKLTQGLSPGLLYYLQSFKQTRGALLDLENKRPGIIDRLLNFEPDEEDLIEINRVVERFAPVLEKNVEKLSKDRENKAVLQALEHVSEEPIHAESIQEKRRDFVRRLTENWKKQLQQQYNTEVAERVSNTIGTKLQTNTTKQTSSSLQFEAQKIANQELRVAKLPVFTQEIDNQTTTQEAIELDTVVTTRNIRSAIAKRMIQDIPVYDPVLFAKAVNEVAAYKPSKIEKPRLLIAEAEALTRTATAFESDYGSTNKGDLGSTNAPRILWSRPELRAVSSENEQLSVINTVVRQGFVDLVNNEGLVNQLGITSVPLLEALQQTFQKSTTTDSSPGFNSAVSGLAKLTNEVVGSVGGTRESQDGYGAFLLVRGTDLLRGRQLQNKLFLNFQFDRLTGKDELLLKFLTLTATDQELVGLREQITNNNKLREWMTTRKDSSPFLAALLENPKQGLDQFRETTNPRVWITMYFSQLYGVQGESRFTKMTGLELYQSAFRIAGGKITGAIETAQAFQAFGGSVGKGLLSKVLILGKMTGGPIGIALMAFGGIKNLIGGAGSFFTNMFGLPSSKKRGTPLWFWVLVVLIGLVVFLLTSDVQTIERSELAEQASVEFGSDLGRGVNPGCYSDASQIVDEANSLLNGLQRGVWNYWNYHPDFPEYAVYSQRAATGDRNAITALYDSTVYNQGKQIGSDLFWCTWLVSLAYRQAGAPAPFTAGVQDAYNRWEDFGGALVSVNNVNPLEVPLGSAIFFNKTGASLAHIGLVCDRGVTNGGRDGYLITCESNGYVKNNTFNVVNGQILSINLSGGNTLSVVGYGFPPNADPASLSCQNNEETSPSPAPSTTQTTRRINQEVTE